MFGFKRGNNPPVSCFPYRRQQLRFTAVPDKYCIKKIILFDNNSHDIIFLLIITTGGRALDFYNNTDRFILNYRQVGW